MISVEITDCYKFYLLIAAAAPGKRSEKIDHSTSFVRAVLWHRISKQGVFRWNTALDGPLVFNLQVNKTFAVNM